MLELFQRDFDYVRHALSTEPVARYVIDGDRPAMLGHWRKHVGIFDMAPLAHCAVAVLLGGKAGTRYRVGDRWSERDAAPGSTQFIPAGRRIAWQINGELDLLTVQFIPSGPARALMAPAVFIDELQFAVADPLSLALGLAVANELERTGDGLSPNHIRALADALCSHLEVKALRQSPAVQPSSGRQSFRKAALLEFIEKNIERSIEVDEIARLFDVSPSYVFRFFKSEFGMTPHAFITRARVDRACVLLQSTSVQLAELADQIGFASQSHFSLVFKRHLGETPQQYRQRRHL
ncbi:AraC family transcriptional regulator [Oleomonas cavernae]|uniref:AraC family transcriptional regulator n=1 Tax=Oleomonas cavernae TaxID=2320859 RepID=A0A418W9I5_9PROT|nr:AraC family transcriptional regulator [Oleomonas cavernae]RJF86691.1 AraC family transcriptional regulator [Oleomonas cavernae]